MIAKRKEKSIQTGLAVSAIAALPAVFFLFLWMISAHAGNTAAVMKMKKTEGTVEVSDASGKEVPVREKLKLYNGYQVATLEESYAWISLDESKLAEMDEVSEAGIRKSGKKLEILLESGVLFFNVSDPLKEEESFHIRTSTTAIGIRGTCGWVEIVDRRTVRISLLEGEVEVSVIDPLTGKVKKEKVSAGETALCVVYGKNNAGGRSAATSSGTSMRRAMFRASC